jgi:hypothetical protein
VVEGDDIDFKGIAGDFLGLDPLDPPHAMRGVDHVIAH